MLSNLFNVENDFWMFANKVADMVILEIIWLVCCLPVVTVGAASTAFWHVFVRMAKDEEGHVVSDFFRAWKERFKTGTGIWMIQLAVGGFFLADFSICLNLGTKGSMFLVGALGMLLFFWLLLSVWFYPLAGSFSFTWKKVLTNSFYLTMRHLPHALAVLILFGSAVAAGIYVPYGVILLPVLACYVNAKVFAWVFAKYEGDRE